LPQLPDKPQLTSRKASHKQTTYGIAAYMPGQSHEIFLALRNNWVKKEGIAFGEAVLIFSNTPQPKPDKELERKRHRRGFKWQSETDYQKVLWLQELQNA